MTDLTASQMAKLIDHTLLKPEATPDQVDKLVSEALELGTYSVCVSPSLIPATMPEGLKLAVVCGFPSGTHLGEVKALEAKLASEQGVDEIDMVINLAFALANDFSATEAEIRAVRQAAPNVVLKTIIESACLSDDQIVGVCKAAEKAGADFVKTSTGFHPAGGASVHAVKLMADTVGGRLGVKASGGIRDGKTAQAMVAAGATRLGLSSSRQILAELDN